MNSVKKFSLLFCLIFSFIFLFGNTFLLQAGSMQERQTLQKCIDSKKYPKEIAECAVYYRVKNINNDSEKEVIWTIGERKFRMAKKPWYQSQYDYVFTPSDVIISKNKKSAKIFVSVYRDGFGFWNGVEKFDLTFELKLN